MKIILFSTYISELNEIMYSKYFSKYLLTTLLLLNMLLLVIHFRQIFITSKIQLSLLKKKKVLVYNLLSQTQFKYFTICA